MQPRVSVIIPVYNSEAYLEKCLDSLITQTLTDLEIIAVDDGSTDDSHRILEEYSRGDSRISVVYKENSGVSDSRNLGIQRVKGEYTGFVDSDDWVDAAMYESMYQTAVLEKADIVMCTYMREFADHAREKVFNLPEKVCYRGDEVREKLVRRLVGPLGKELREPAYLDAWGPIWSKLYRTALIKEHGIRFVDLKEIGSNEDSLFNIHAFYHAGTAVFLNKPFYHYRRSNSGSVTSRYRPGLKEQWFRLYDHMEAFVGGKDLSTDFHTALNNRICMNVLGLGFNIACEGNRASWLAKIRSLRDVITDSRMKEAFARFEPASLSLSWKLFYFLAKYRMAALLFCMIKAISILR